MGSFKVSRNSEKKIARKTQMGMEKNETATYKTGLKSPASNSGLCAAAQGLMTFMVCSFVGVAANVEVELEGSGAAGAGVDVQSEEASDRKTEGTKIAETHKGVKAVGGAWVLGNLKLRIRASCEASAGVKAAAAGSAQGRVDVAEATSKTTNTLLSGAMEYASLASKWWHGTGKPDAATTEAVDGIWARVHDIEDMIGHPLKYTKTTILNSIDDALTRTRTRSPHYHQVRSKLLHLRGDVCWAWAWDLATTADYDAVKKYLQESQKAYWSSNELYPTAEVKAMRTNAMSITPRVLIDTALALELATHMNTSTTDAQRAVELSTSVLQALTGCTETQREFQSYVLKARASASFRLATATFDIDTQLSLLNQADKDLASITTLDVTITFLHVRLATNIYEAITAITTPALPPPVIHSFKPLQALSDSSSSHNNDDDTFTDNKSTTAFKRLMSSCARVCGSIKARLRNPMSSCIPFPARTNPTSCSTRAIMDLGHAEGLIFEGRFEEALPIIDGAIEVLSKKQKHAKVAKTAVDLKARATAAAPTQQ